MTGLNFLFNLFWVIFVGLISAISSFLVGLGCCITIIGIPFGLQHFKFVKLVFAPAGKTVFTHFGKHPVMNVLWLIFGGLPAAVLYFVLGTVMLLTVVGAPLALQLYKIATFNLAPFGAEIVRPGEYTKGKNTLYDYDLLTKRIIANPHVVLGVGENGAPNTVISYLCTNADRMEEEENRVLLYNTRYDAAQRYSFVALIIMAMLAVFVSEQFQLSWILAGVCIAAILAVGYALMTVCEYYFYKKPLIACYSAQYKFLFDYYPQGAPTSNCKIHLNYTTTLETKDPFTKRTRVVKKSARVSRIKVILHNVEKMADE